MSDLTERARALWGPLTLTMTTERFTILALCDEADKLDGTLRAIAGTGTDCPAGYEPEDFYRSQLYGCIGAAARALAELEDTHE